MSNSPTLSGLVAGRIAAWDATAGRTDASALALVRRLAPTGVPPVPAGTSSDLGFIRAAFAAGHETFAIAALRSLTETHQANAEAHLLLCIVLLRRADPDAGRVLERCLAAAPGPSPAWVEVGDVLLARGKPEAALVCFAKGPPSAAHALKSGLVARDLGRPAEALSWFGQAVRYAPASERSWFLLGVSAQDCRDYPGAIDAYRTVLGLNPARVEAQVNLGMCLQAMGRLADAKDSYARAVQARPATFGRIAQALPGSPRGELWLDLGALRRSLAG